MFEYLDPAAEGHSTHLMAHPGMFAQAHGQLWSAVVISGARFLVECISA